jgi:hypothetical protein
MLARHQLARKCLSTRLTQNPWRQTRSMATLLGSNPDTTGSADPSKYCKDLVRKYDYESFLTSQFYPKEMQGGYFALKAFYVSFLDILILCDVDSSDFMCEGRAGDDTGYRIEFHAWKNENAVLERRGQTNIRCTCSLLNPDYRAFTDYASYVGQTSKASYRTRLV